MTLIIGHRGSAGSFPENTMISFKAAMDAGANGIELDVQMTNDGEIVVIHDEKVDRTTNGTGFVKDLTLAEISRLDASYTFPEYKGSANVPTLKEVLEWATTLDSCIVNVELKNGIIDYPNIEEKTIELINHFNLQKRVIISSFNHYSLVKCKEISSDIETAILYMEGLYKPWDYAMSIGAKGLHPHFYAANPKIILESQQCGIDVRPFTVNEIDTIDSLFKNKCSAIITDFPELAAQLKKHNE